MKTEILKQDLKMLNVALECYMGKDLEEDSNLSRPVKQALKDFEELIDKYTKFNEDKSCTYMCDVRALLEEELSFCKEELGIYKKALKNACRLALRNNHSGRYIAIHEGTREQYNLPLTFDDIFNEKILNDYLLEETRKELENGK